MKKDNLPYKASFRLFEGCFDFLALDIKIISWNLVNLQKLIFFSLRNALQRINSFYLSPNRFNSRGLRIMVLLISLMVLNKSGFAQSGTFRWYDGVSSGNVWNATDVSKTFTISCGTGCVVNVTMTIIDPNNRNCDPDTYTTNPFDSGNGCLPYPNTPTVETDNVTGNGLILDPWDSDCNPVFTQTSGAYGPNFLTFAMNSFTHLDDVTIRFTFSKPVFLDNFTVGDIDGRTLLQDYNQNQTGSPAALSRYELPGNSYQDEVTVTATGVNGNVNVNYSALGSLTTRVGQTVRSVYNNSSINLTPDDARGTITVTTDDAITQLDITYSNGPDDAAAEQANPNYYSWWINGGTFTLSDGRTITQPAKAATNGASDNHAIRVSGFNFTACPDFTFTRTNATVCAGKTATIGITPANGTTPYTYSWTGPSGFTSTSQNPTIANVTASQAGVYTVTAVDANGCTGTSTASVAVNPLPTPTISANSTVCVGANVNLTASGGNKYIWSGPNSFSSTLQTPTINNVSTSASGTYIVNVEGANGCTVDAQTILTVQPNPTPTVNSPTICSGESATLTVSNCTGGTVTWSNGLPSGTTATVSPTTTITYTVTCTVGTCTGTATSTVTVNPRPTPTVNSPTICSGESATLTVSNCTGGTVTWSNGLPSGTTATVSPTTTTTYTATCTVGTCTGTATSTVTVNPRPTPTVNSPTICSGESATLTVSNCTGGTVTWSSGLPSGTTATVSPMTTTTYTATCTVGTCTGTATSTVTVNPRPTPTVNSPTICSGESATLTVSNCTGGTVTWSSGLPSGTTATVSPTTTTTYTATCTVGTCTGTATSTVTVNPRPTPTVNSPTICSGESATLTVSNCTGGTVTWSNGLPSGTTSTVSPTTTTSYTATCTVGTCIGTATSTVTVNPRPTPTVNSPTICSGESATLTVSNCTGGTVTWSNGLPSGTTSTVSPTTTTSYTATCTVGTCTGTATSTVTVNPRPTPTVNSPTICSGESATLTVSNCTGGTVTWSNGLPSGTTATVSPMTTTTYTATCTVGTCTGTATSTVTVNPRPTLSVVNTSCASNLQTYNISFTSNGTVTSTQGVVDNNSKTVSNIPIGTNVTLTASLNSCLTNLNVTSPVCNCPVVNPPVSGGDKTICANSAFPALSVTVGSNESANWYDINNNLVASNTTSYTPTTGGTYLVESYNLVDNCKSTTKTEVKLNITPIPTITPVVSIATCRGKLSNNDAKINFTATNGDKYHIVIGETVAVTDNYANASTLNVGSGSKINIANPSSPVKYTIRVYNGSNTCYTDSTVTLNPADCKLICVEPLKCVDLKVKINK